MIQNMNFLDSLFTRLKEENEQYIEKEKSKLNLIEKRKQLENIQSYLSQYYKKVYYRKNKTRWSNILILNNTTYEINYNKIKANEQIQHQFIQYLMEAYQLITSILSELKLIHSVRTVITSIGEDYSYFRFPNMEYNIDFIFLNKQSSEKGQDYGLRIKKQWENILKNKIKITDGQILLNEHFQAFIQPFILYQKQASNTTHWKINKGVLGETFERHLQNRRHNNIEDLKNNSIEHLGSIGERWVLYKMSSGSDPFFTGPDTKITQIKNINASIVSNIQTLITAINGILNLIDKNGEITEPQKTLDKIFKRVDFKMSLSQEVYKDLEEQAPQVIKSILQELLKEGITKITLTKKIGKNTRQKTYKINTENLLLEVIKK